MVFKIILAIAVVVMSYFLGYARATKQALDELTDIKNDVDRAIKAHDRVIDAAIESCESYIRNTRNYLALFRDEGHDKEDLDALIQNMDGFLDNFKERKNYEHHTNQ